MNKTVLIMAGGRGERFWPRSRKNLPKQFLTLTDNGRTMIQNTVDRVKDIVAFEDIYISTNDSYKSLVKAQLPEIPEENIICEPVGRNTAPCIGLAAVNIKKKYDDALMIVLPSDHLVSNKMLFETAVLNACDIAEKEDNIVTLGIAPTYPETGYGYIKIADEAESGTAFKVDRFVEKPSYDVAKEYVASEKYLWNSGMFIWKLSTIMNKFESYLPNISIGLHKIYTAITSESIDIADSVIRTEFEGMESISIDYGILEKSENIYVIPVSFGWDDVGSWIALDRLKKPDENGNIKSGDVIDIDTEKCIIEGKDKLIATVGLRDIVIIEEEDAILICDKEKVGDIRKVVACLKDADRNELL